MFIICAVVFFIGGTFYIFFCDGNIQDWAVNKKEELRSIKSMEKYAYDNQEIVTVF